MQKRLFINTAFFNAAMLAVSLLMTAEYARLILYTETAKYRIFILFAWLGISLFAWFRIVRLRHQNLTLSVQTTNQKNSDTSESDNLDRSP